MTSLIPTSTPFPRVLTILPGPTRKRESELYEYRITYRNLGPAPVGCVVTWEVEGGRMPYQIALERNPAGTLRYHCTCADAVFRAEVEGRDCKHVRGLLEVQQLIRPE